MHKKHDVIPLKKAIDYLKLENVNFIKNEAKNSLFYIENSAKICKENLKTLYMGL